MHYKNHLSKDEKLKQLIDKQEVRQLKKEKNICLYLCYSIMSQQLSTQVAKVFHKRFIELYGGKEPTAKQIAETKFETLRGIGLSNAKANYVLNVARFELENGMDAKHLHKLSDEEVIKYLTQIKGVGKWTVEMLLMFALGREDIFSADDLGIQNAMIRLYNLKPRNKNALKKRMHQISNTWSPYRTYACLHLWGWKDGKDKK